MTEVTTVPDLRGTPVGVGDTIVYGATDNRSAGMRIGKVIEVVEAHTVSENWGFTRDVPTKLKVEVEISSGYSVPAKPVLIEAGFKRFVKLEPAPTPEPVPKTREEMAAFAKRWDERVEAGRAKV